jgi:hypothetical protein
MAVTAIVIAGGVVALVAGIARGATRARPVERSVAGLATVQVPARLEPRPLPLQDWYGTSLYLTRSMNSFSAMGSNSPQHENLLITQLHPVMVHRRGADLLDQFSYVFEYTADVTWEPLVPRGTYQIRFANGRYTPNTMDTPALLAQGFDVAKGVAVSYRGLADDISREQLSQLLDQVMASYTVTANLPAYFNEVPRDLGAGITVGLPIELTDPFSLRTDPSGAVWMYFRRYREWAEDPEMPEQSVAVLAFFEPGNARQADAAQAILTANADPNSEVVDQEVRVHGNVSIDGVLHHAGGRAEPSWRAFRTDAGRGIAVAYRVWQKNQTAQGAADVVTRTIDSYHFSGEPGFFGPKASE